MNYELLQFDTVIATFNHSYETEILDPSLVPLYLQKRYILGAWLAERSIDTSRPHSRFLKRMLHLSPVDDIELVLSAHSATMTDNYWTRREGEDICHKDVRFRSDALGEIALNGDASSVKEEDLSSSTPELTNNGSNEKCWRLLDGEWNLIKSQSVDENFSEVFTSIFAEELGFSTALYFPYYDENHKGSFVRTPLFLDTAKYNFQSANSFLDSDEYDYVSIAQELEQLDPTLLDSFLDLMFLDALTYNVDRHNLNFGIITDVRDGSIVSLAPNYDNNMTLLYHEPLKPSEWFIKDYKKLFKLYPSYLEQMPDWLTIKEKVAVALQKTVELFEDFSVPQNVDEIPLFMKKSYRLLFCGDRDIASE